MNDISDLSLGRYLSNLRSEKGCGYRVASEGIGVQPSELRQYEWGYAIPPTEVMRAISSFYGVDVDRLFALAEQSTLITHSEPIVILSHSYQDTEEFKRLYHREGDEV